MDRIARQQKQTETIIKDFGFWNDLEYVELMTDLLELSHFQAWPKQGGTEDQESSLIEDVITLLRLRQAVKDGSVMINRYEEVAQDVPRLTLSFGGSDG